MSAELLKVTMEAKKKTVINVASDTGLGTNTIKRYLDGQSVNLSTEKLLELWVAQHSKESSNSQEAV